MSDATKRGEVGIPAGAIHFDELCERCGAHIHGWAEDVVAGDTVAATCPCGERMVLTLSAVVNLNESGEA